MTPANNDANVRRLLRHRERQAIEPLYENSALRDNLDDEQAESVLTWGADQIASMVKFTAVLGEDDATAVIESRATAVRQALRWLNTAVAQNVASADTNLNQLWDALSHVVALPAELPETVVAWWQEIQALPPAERFQQLQALIQHPENWVELTASPPVAPEPEPSKPRHTDENRPRPL